MSQDNQPSFKEILRTISAIAGEGGPGKVEFVVGSLVFAAILFGLPGNAPVETQAASRIQMRLNLK